MNNKFDFLGLSFRIIKNKDKYDLYCQNIYLYTSKRSIKESFIKNCIDNEITQKDILNYISKKISEKYTLKRQKR